MGKFSKPRPPRAEEPVRPVRKKVAADPIEKAEAERTAASAVPTDAPEEEYAKLRKTGSSLNSSAHRSMGARLMVIIRALSGFKRFRNIGYSFC